MFSLGASELIKYLFYFLDAELAQRITNLSVLDQDVVENGALEGNYM